MDHLSNMKQKSSSPDTSLIIRVRIVTAPVTGEQYGTKKSRLEKKSNHSHTV